MVIDGTASGTLSRGRVYSGIKRTVANRSKYIIAHTPAVVLCLDIMAPPFLVIGTHSGRDALRTRSAHTPILARLPCVIALAHVRTQDVTCDAVCLPSVSRSVCLCVVIRLVPFGTLRTHGIVSVSVVMALHSNM